MKTKLRRFTAVLSAMLCMICCVLSAVPAFADDTDSVFTEHIFSQLENTYPHSEYSYMVISYKPSNSSFTFFQCFVVSQSSKFYYNSSDRTVSTDGTFIDSFVHRFKENSCTREVSYGSIVYADIKDFNIIYSDLPVYEGDSPIYTDPNAPIVPFSVQYSPTLCTEMSNKIYYPSKGGANADSSGLVEDENYNLSVKVKLTDDFLKKTAVQNGYLEYSYQYTLFIVPSQFKDSDIKTMSDKAIYTAVNKSQFLYTGNERLDIDHSQTSEPATDVDTSKDVDNQWANANGITNCFYIPRDGSKSTTSTVNIDLHTVNWSKYDYDSYNIVVLSHVIRKTEYGWTAYPYYFTSDCEDLSKESKKEYPIKANADDPTKYDNVELYDYYTVVSDDFSLKDIPEYVQQTCDGTTIDQNSPLDFKNKADTVQDYELWKNGEKKNQKDFDDYKKQKQQAENFSDVNFGIDDISSIFDGTSSFYKFLTASISILPPYFLLILGAFFVTMLAICVVKWVLK